MQALTVSPSFELPGLSYVIKGRWDVDTTQAKKATPGRFCELPSARYAF